MFEIGEKVLISNIIHNEDKGRKKYLNTIHIISTKTKVKNFTNIQKKEFDGFKDMYGFEDTPSPISSESRYLWNESELEKVND
jgi:hypothetical protein